MNVTVIGGGVVGLSSAYYLREQGCEVTVIDKENFLDNCSYGNAGYICPSHFVPLATPGIVKQGIKWMGDPRSPFYVQPRLDLNLIKWGLKFMKVAKPENVELAAIPLRDIAIISQKMYESWTKIPGFDFAYEHKGLLEVFQTDAGEEKCKHLLEKAHELGLTDTVLLNYNELQELEPQTRINAKGALFFKCDAHLYPNKLMAGLLNQLQQMGVRFIKEEAVTGFDKKGKQITAIRTAKNIYTTDAVVLATGSWSRELAAKLNLDLLLMPGRGYSVTLEDSPYKLNHPAVLVEGRAALTPMDGNKIRFGGTMEITSTKTPPRLIRVEGLLQAVKKFYPDFDVPMPSADKIWYGFRPCSADGLPYLGKSYKWDNLVIATGHSMIGMSLGAGTGKLVSEVLLEQPLSMDIRPFDPDRFS
ncbi:MAG: FAD-dependent oxidoreductase [Sediminibacterium sp.]|nr:FAD-dependent oxidoreductase [Sediminibacterium sp.]